ncbi:MAG TPA: N-acetylmuramoyl-L-alanine amidase [Chiayiivirga sp.]|nr:N-acetylmuramoyl-L-alanine amidase [Chiayiivirga sp.]
MKTILRLLAPLAFLILAACAPLPARNPMAQWVHSPNEEPRRAVIIVIHATEQDSVARSLHTLRTGNSGGPVSSHYLIGRDGDLYQLVADERRAWHAGGGRWGTITDLNSASIGIELDNDASSDYPPAQIDALLRLLDDLCTRYSIPRSQVIAHADLAPTRRRDPGVLFPWQTLAQAGFGVWPPDDAGPAPEGFDFWLAMTAFGYALDDPEAALRAFRRRFRAVEGDDSPPGADDARILHALLVPYRPASGR